MRLVVNSSSGGILSTELQLSHEKNIDDDCKKFDKHFALYK